MPFLSAPQQSTPYRLGDEDAYGADKCIPRPHLPPSTRCRHVSAPSLRRQFLALCIRDDGTVISITDKCVIFRRVNLKLHHPSCSYCPCCPGLVWCPFGARCYQVPRVETHDAMARLTTSSMCSLGESPWEQLLALVEKCLALLLNGMANFTALLLNDTAFLDVVEVLIFWNVAHTVFRSHVFQSSVLDNRLNSSTPMRISLETAVLLAVQSVFKSRSFVILQAPFLRK